jgi:hypothetical protein
MAALKKEYAAAENPKKKGAKKKSAPKKGSY